ncbi:MAG TPA: hypothetical protein VN805_14210 [Caulobacteraceae bacterium]|nr:hypothetical protein [Caulobacteraceae bacterium]
MTHDHKRLAFWLILAALFATGLVLLLVLPNHHVVGVVALGFLALLILKHVGLFLVVGAPLTGFGKWAQVQLKRLHQPR